MFPVVPVRHSGHSASIWQPFFSFTFSPCKTQSRHRSEQNQFMSLSEDHNFPRFIYKLECYQTECLWKVWSAYIPMHICVGEVLCNTHTTNIYAYMRLYTMLYT